MLKILLPILFVTSVYATPWESNRDHSEVFFQVPYMQVSEVTGRFNEFTSTTDFDDKKLAFKTLEVKIKTDSIDTGNKMRDGHLEDADFLSANQFPFITFTSSNILVANAKTKAYKAFGSLSIKGIAKLATVEFTLTDSMKDTWGYENRFVKFKSTINRKDYNITWNKSLDGKQLLVGDMISIWGTFQLQLSSGKTPNSKHMIPDTEIIRKRDEIRMKNGPVEESFISKKLKALINNQ